MLDEIQRVLYEATESLSLDLLKIDTYLESIFREYEMNTKAAELKVLKESGTAEDLTYLYEAAGEVLNTSVIKGIEKSQESSAKFFSTVKDNILSIMNDDKTGIAALEKKVSLNAIAKSKQVSIENFKQIEKTNDSTFSKLLVARAKIKVNGENSINVTKEIIDEYKKSRAKVVGAAGSKSVSLPAAIREARKMGRDANRYIDSVQKKLFDAYKKLISIAKKSDYPSAITELSRSFTDVAKNMVNDYVDVYRNILSAIKNGIAGKAVKESSDNDFDVKDSDIEKVMKGSADDSGMTKEGEDPDNDVPGEDPADTINDPWDDIINGMDNNAGNPVGGVDNMPELSATIEAAYDELFGRGKLDQSIDNEYMVKGKPDNDTIVSQLYQSIKGKALGYDYKATSQTGDIPADAHLAKESYEYDDDEIEDLIAESDALIDEIDQFLAESGFEDEEDPVDKAYRELMESFDYEDDDDILDGDELVAEMAKELDRLLED